MNYAALLGLNEIDNAFGSFFLKFFYPYDNLMKVKQTSHTVAECQQYGNICGISVFISLVVVIAISFNTENYDAFLKGPFILVYVALLLIGTTLLQYLASKIGLNHHELIRFSKDE